MENTVRIIQTILIAATLIAGVLLYRDFSGKQEQVYRQQVITTCMERYSQTVETETGTITRPLEQQVRECTWQLGVRDWNGIWSGPGVEADNDTATNATTGDTNIPASQN